MEYTVVILHPFTKQVGMITELNIKLTCALDRPKSDILFQQIICWSVVSNPSLIFTKLLLSNASICRMPLKFRQQNEHN